MKPALRPAPSRPRARAAAASTRLAHAAAPVVLRASRSSRRGPPTTCLRPPAFCVPRAPPLLPPSELPAQHHCTVRERARSGRRGDVTVARARPRSTKRRKGSGGRTTPPANFQRLPPRSPRRQRRQRTLRRRCAEFCSRWPTVRAPPRRGVVSLRSPRLAALYSAVRRGRPQERQVQCAPGSDSATARAFCNTDSACLASLGAALTRRPAAAVGCAGGSCDYVAAARPVRAGPGSRGRSAAETDALSASHSRAP